MVFALILAYDKNML